MRLGLRLTVIMLVLSVAFFAGCSGGKIESKLGKGLQSKDAEVRRKAAIELGDVATVEALRLLELQADDPDFRVREEVRKSLHKINSRTFFK